MRSERITKEIRVWKGFLKDMAQEAVYAARRTGEELKTRYQILRLREELRDRYAQLGKRFFESLEKEEGNVDVRDEIQELVREIYEYQQWIRDLEEKLHDL